MTVVAEGARIEVAIVTFNSERHIERCIDSVARQGPVDTVHVWDNASQDGSRRILYALRERYAGVLDIRVTASSRNIGFGGGMNALIVDTDTENYLLLLNPDVDLADPSPGTDLAELVNLAESADRVGVIGVRLVTESGELDHACKRGEPTVLGALGHLIGLGPRSRLGRAASAYRMESVAVDAVADVDAVNGAFMLCTPMSRLVVSGFDDRFFMYAEDLDWCRRVRDAGFRVVYVGHQVARHVKGGSEPTGRGWRSHRAFYVSMGDYYRKYSASVIISVLVQVAVRVLMVVTWVASRLRRATL